MNYHEIRHLGSSMEEMRVALRDDQMGYGARGRGSCVLATGVCTGENQQMQ